MELVESARILWRRRALTGSALVASVVIGLFVAFKPSLIPPGLQARTHTVGQAAAQVLIDTHHSQISDVNPAGAQNLYSRATLLADVLATAPSQARLAELMRIDPRRLEVTPPVGSGLAPIRPTALGTAGAAAATVTPTWTLTVTLDPTLPLIGISTQAPTVADAGALARGAITILNDQVQSSAKAQGVPQTRQVVINTISPPVSSSAVQGVRKAFGLLAMLITFCLLCFAIVLWDGSAMARRRHARAGQSSLREALGSLQLQARMQALLEVVDARARAARRTRNARRARRAPGRAGTETARRRRQEPAAAAPPPAADATEAERAAAS